MLKSTASKEFAIESLLFAASAVAVVVLILISLFLFGEGAALFKDIPFLDFLSGRYWYPTSEPPLFGLLPMLLGTLFVTAGAIVIAVPLGIA
ncbi:MAG: phosphate ABC transporter permease subunit PstC, partial [Methanosarcinaceae archaeon]|nr:phosphate ABC transporter permease subunit PstC [Methanosarcinaceae archaeon]